MHTLVKENFIWNDDVDPETTTNTTEACGSYDPESAEKAKPEWDKPHNDFFYCLESFRDENDNETKEMNNTIDPPGHLKTP